MAAMHEPLAKKADKPIAGLLKDLKSRGMLEDTLVVWTTEFGRKPGDASPDEEGRTHWSTAYSSWMAGGGVKAGVVYGATDEYGLTIASNPVHIHDFQATILNQLGLDHTKLTFRHAGRDYRLTDVSGHVVKDIIS
jgi:arylsulfatase A-like enzyme